MKSVGHWIVENFRICSLCLLSATWDIRNIHLCLCVCIYVFIYSHNMNERQVIWSKMNFVRIESDNTTRLFVHCPFRFEGRSPAPDRVSLLKKIRWKQCYEFKFNWRLKLKSIDNNYVYLFFLYYEKTNTRSTYIVVIVAFARCCYVTSIAAASRPVNRVDHLEQCSITRFVRNHFVFYCMQKSVSTLTYITYIQRTNRLNVSLTARAPVIELGLEVKQGFGSQWIRSIHNSKVSI